MASECSGLFIDLLENEKKDDDLMVNSYNIRQIQLTQLEILIEVDKICCEHDIKYFLTAGTLLGAVRHKGFIPWDDDIDIGMHRKDYDNFLEIANKELDEKYFCQSIYSETNYYLPFAKIRKNKTRYVEASAKHLDINKGVYIDLFPMDNVPDNTIARFIHRIEFYILFRIVLAKSGVGSPDDRRVLKRMVYGTLKIFSIPFKKRNFLLYMDQRMKKYSGNKTRYVTSMAGAYGYTREKMPSCIFESVTKIEFEGQLFYAPSRSHEYLTRLYGDYMTLPPVGQRENRHGIIEVKL